MWQKNTSRWSLWTIIRYHIMTGDLTVYSPFNPMWEQWKDGDMFKYPIKSKIPGGTYETDKAFREEVFIYMGTEIRDPFAEPLKVICTQMRTVWFKIQLLGLDSCVPSK